MDVEVVEVRKRLELLASKHLKDDKEFYENRCDIIRAKSQRCLLEKMKRAVVAGKIAEIENGTIHNTI
mgnify:CR=1 FL=1|jgi:hypothetical protein